MITFALIITGLAVWAIAGSLVALRHDGYRRQPTRPHLNDPGTERPRH